eukprot:4148540-Amphidinium_carterae.1
MQYRATVEASSAVESDPIREMMWPEDFFSILFLSSTAASKDRASNLPQSGLSLRLLGVCAMASACASNSCSNSTYFEQRGTTLNIFTKTM